MKCANPECLQSSHDLLEGTLWRLELEASPEERTLGSEGGFPICSVPTRYFWLCGRCSKRLVIKRWTAGGLVFGAAGVSRVMDDKVAPASVRPVGDKSATDFQDVYRMGA